MAAHWNLKKILSSIREEGRHNKFVNYPSQTLTTNIRMNGDSKVDCVSQCTLERFSHLSKCEIYSMSELWKLLEQNPQNVLHIGDSGLISGGWSPTLDTEAVRWLGVVSLYIPHSIRHRKKKKKIWKHWSHSLSPNPPPFPPLSST